MLIVLVDLHKAAILNQIVLLHLAEEVLVDGEVEPEILDILGEDPLETVAELEVKFFDVIEEHGVVI